MVEIWKISEIQFGLFISIFGSLGLQDANRQICKKPKSPGSIVIICKQKTVEYFVNVA